MPNSGSFPLLVLVKNIPPPGNAPISTRPGPRPRSCADALTATLEELREALAAAAQERAEAEADWRAELKRGEAKASELSEAAAEAARRSADLEAASNGRIKGLERAVAEATEARLRGEREMGARVVAAEARLADAARRLTQSSQDRKEAEARALRALADAQARFQEELQHRDHMRTQEAQRLQAALQERSRQLRVAELDLQRLRAGNVVLEEASPKAGVVDVGPLGAPGAIEAAAAGGEHPVG